MFWFLLGGAERQIVLCEGDDTGGISAELTAQDFELSHFFLGASLKKTGHRGVERVIGGEK